MAEEKNLKSRICPTCGATDAEKEFMDFFCIDCYRKHHKEKPAYQIPKEIVIHQCKNCSVYKIRRWYGTMRETGADILSLFKGNISDVNVVSLSDKRAVVDYSSEGINSTEEIPVRIHRTLCNNCTKMKRGYFEAIVQLRGDKDWVERLRERLEQNLARSTFITKEEEFKYGIDLYVGSTRSVREVMSSMGFKPKKSERLHTAKEGRKLYRVTFLLRQPEAPVAPEEPEPQSEEEEVEE